MSSKIKKGKTSDAKFFYIGIIAAVAGVQIALKVVTTLYPDTSSQTCSRIMEAALTLFAIFLSLRTTFVQPWLGLRVKKSEIKQTVFECILLAFVIVAAFIAARLLLSRLSPEIAARPFFRTYFNIKHRRYYLFFTLIQEALAKGVLQHGVEKTLPDDKWYIALPVSALVFGMLHIYHSPYYIFGAVALALVSGLLYHRQKNIWSSFVLHFLIAFLPRCFGLK